MIQALSISDGDPEELGDPQQIEEMIRPNLEYAAACLESARMLATTFGVRENLTTVATVVGRAVHFLQLAQHYVEELQKVEAAPILLALTPEMAARLRGKAAAQGLDLVTYLSHMAERDALEGVTNVFAHARQESGAP